MTKTKKRFICRDLHGSALIFTSSGKSLQVQDECADEFEDVYEAGAALKKANEIHGTVLEIVTPRQFYLRMMRENGRKGGLAKSKAKIEACRKNGLQPKTKKGKR